MSNGLESPFVTFITPANNGRLNETVFLKMPIKLIFCDLLAQ